MAVGRRHNLYRRRGNQGRRREDIDKEPKVRVLSRSSDAAFPELVHCRSGLAGGEHHVKQEEANKPVAGVLGEKGP